MPSSLRNLLQLLLVQSRQVLNLHWLAKVAAIFAGVSAFFPVIDLCAPSLEASVASLVAALICKFTQPVTNLFSGPAFDHTFNVRRLSIKPIGNWSDTIQRAVARVPVRSLSKEISDQEYRDINEYLKEPKYVDARQFLVETMRTGGKITYRELLSLIVYVEGKDAWLERLDMANAGQHARQEILQDDLFPFGIGNVAGLDDRKGGTSPQQDDASRKNWRKITLENQENGTDEH